MLRADAGIKYLELCSVCGELLLPPIYQCQAGHLFCECCESKLDICPEEGCQRSVSTKIRNTYLERQLHKTILDCKYCSLRFPVLSFRDHQFDCLQRKQNLCLKLGLSCQSWVSLSEVASHLRSEHNLTGVELEDCSTSIEILQGVTRTSLDSNSVRWKPHFIQIGEKLFVLRTVLEPELQCVSWNVCFAGSDHSARNIFGMIRLSSLKLDSSEPTLQWHGKILSVHSQTIEKRFRVHVSTLKHFDSGAEKLDLTEAKLKWKIQAHIYSANDSDGNFNIDRDINTKFVVVADDASDPVKDNVPSNTTTNDFVGLLRTIRYHFKLFMETF
ncbi:unnamed protein product [Allacma fusca]|uniref:E3 ubiquitin-protein ligase Sina-like RING finger domain-containing protein n=1 Tax=Allacma fusca TaxID=39272 RepID=A0A8J2JRH4_9HEXA|nr:unnamed protein product [Allacma fusca]